MKISIVVTVYNIEKYIKTCVDSILSQTYKNIEVIFVDDCGTDSSMDIIRTYTDERIKIVTHKENMGAGWARRHGIEASTGEYVITVDGDDWISETFIEDLANNAIETGADIVSGGITYVYSDEYHEIKRFFPMISKDFKKFLDYNNGKIVFLNNKIVRRSMYETTPYCTRRYCEDTPTIFPLLYYANMVSYVDNQGYFYVQHEQSLCHKTNLFEKGLFKALCCQDMILFFSDKGDEYRRIINKDELMSFLKIMDDTITPELCKQYKKELIEIKPLVDVILKQNNKDTNTNKN